MQKLFANLGSTILFTWQLERSVWFFTFLRAAELTSVFKCSGPLNPANQTGAKAHIARAARQDFQRVMSMMRMVEKYWRGVRYIIRALEQKAEGIQQVDISDDGDGLPPNLLALLESATERPAGDGKFSSRGS